MCQWRHPLLLFLLHTAFLVPLSSLSPSKYGRPFSIFTSAAVAGDNEIIHDDLSSFFTYSGNWFTVSPGRSCASCVGDADPAKAHAASWSDGNTARQSAGSCKFFGRGIAIYGIHFRQQGSMIFQLDGNAPVTYNRAISEHIYEYDQEFFRVDGLDDTVEHTLTFKVGVNSENGEHAILLDYARVLLPIEKNTVVATTTNIVTSVRASATDKGSADAVITTAEPSTERVTTASDGRSTTITVRVSPSTPTSTSTSTPTTTGTRGVSETGLADAQDTPTTSPSSANESSATGNATSNSGPSTGLIAGAAVGGVSAGILILALVLFLWRRRSRRRRQWHGMESNLMADNAAAPSNAAYLQSYRDEEDPSTRTDAGSSSNGFTRESTIPGRILVVPSEKERRMRHQEWPAAAESVNGTEVDEDPALLQQRIRELELELAAQQPPGYSG